ncbi:MAG: hypothetical protein ACKO6Q_08500 [Bacteroidota bacterium]
MSEHPHRTKYELQLILAFLLLLGFIGITYFTIFVVQKIGTWYFLAAVAGIMLCGAAYFLSSATTHKIKSDINRKARQREVHKHFTHDS